MDLPAELRLMIYHEASTSLPASHQRSETSYGPNLFFQPGLLIQFHSSQEFCLNLRLVCKQISAEFSDFVYQRLRMSVWIDAVTPDKHRLFRARERPRALELLPLIRLGRRRALDLSSLIRHVNLVITRLTSEDCEKTAALLQTCLGMFHQAGNLQKFHLHFNHPKADEQSRRYWMKAVVRLQMQVERKVRQHGLSDSQKHMEVADGLLHIMKAGLPSYQA
jgi:hypothetical protein